VLRKGKIRCTYRLSRAPNTRREGERPGRRSADGSGRRGAYSSGKGRRPRAGRPGASLTLGPNFFRSSMRAWKWHSPNRIPWVLSKLHTKRHMKRHMKRHGREGRFLLSVVGFHGNNSAADLERACLTGVSKQRRFTRKAGLCHKKARSCERPNGASAGFHSNLTDVAE